MPDKAFQMIKTTKAIVRYQLGKHYLRFLLPRNGFYFVDVPRTSSSSIRLALAKRFGGFYGKFEFQNGRLKLQNRLIRDHRTAKEIQCLIGNSMWNKLFTFSVVRNPWDRVVSMYHYRRKIAGSIPETWSFRDYVFALAEATPKTEYFKFQGYRFGNSDFLLGDNGEILVDFIARYENRSLDLDFIGRRLNMDSFKDVHINKGKPKYAHFSEFYDVDTREIIQKLYSKDIELFDYKFN